MHWKCEFKAHFSEAQNGVYYIPSEKEAAKEHTLVKHTDNDSLKMLAYYYISGYYTELNKDTSLYYANLQRQTAKALKQPLWEADALFQISYISWGLGNYPKSFNAIKDGLAITDREESEKNNWRINTFSGDGNAHKASLFIASALHQIFAFLYISTANTPKAIQEFTTAIKTAERVDNKAELSLDNMSLGGTYIGLGKLDSALVIENKARQYAIESNYKIYMGAILEAIGDIYFIKKKYDSAGKYYKDALVASKEQLNLKDVINANLSIAKWMRTTGRTDSSRFYAKNALVTAQSLGLPSGRRGAYNALFKTYKMLGNKDSAFVYLELAKTLGDSLDTIERDKINEYQRLNLNNTIRLQEEEKERIRYSNQIRMYSLLAGLAALLVIAFLLFRNNRTKHQANLLLHAQKQQLEDQKQQLEAQKEQLQSTLTELQQTQQELLQAEKMATMGKLTKGIVDRILNPLNYINNFSLAAQELLREILTVTQKHQATFSPDDQDDLEDATTMLTQNLTKINEHGNSTARILQDMQKLLKERSSTFLITDLNPYLTQQINACFPKALANYPSLSVQLDLQLAPQSLPVTLLPVEFSEVLASLIDNACYTLAEKSRRVKGLEPRLELSTQAVDDQVQLQVRDNGRGIPAKEASQLFNPFFTTKPTAKGTGLGLYMGKEVVEYLHGQMQIESVEEQYTQVTILLPLKSVLVTS